MRFDKQKKMEAQNKNCMTLVAFQFAEATILVCLKGDGYRCTAEIELHDEFLHIVLCACV